MNEPKRLSRSDGDLGLLLRAARRAKPPGRSRERSLAAAVGVLGASGSAAGVAAAGEGATVGVAKASALASAKWVAIVGLTGAGAVAGTAAVLPRHSAAPAPVVSAATAEPRAGRGASPATSSTSQGEPASSVGPLDGPVPTSVASAPPDRPAPPAAPAPAPVAAAESSAATLSGELELLDQARAMLARGDAPRALAILDRYADRFPAGTMAPEATMLRIEALVKAGDRAAAKRFARAFLESDPDGPYGPRVQSVLGETNP